MSSKVLVFLFLLSAVLFLSSSVLADDAFNNHADVVKETNNADDAKYYWHGGYGGHGYRGGYRRGFRGHGGYRHGGGYGYGHRGGSGKGRGGPHESVETEAQVNTRN